MQEHLGGWAGGLAVLEATLLDHPWTDPELPSLVALDERGQIVGFIGAQTRRLMLDKRPVRAVCCSHLVVDPASRSGAVGALLLGQLFRGEQEMTWSDSASDEVDRMWTVFGGRADGARAYDWMLVLRPMRWSERALGALVRRREIDRDTIPVAGLPMQAAGRRLLKRAHPAEDPDVRGADASVAEIVASLPETSRRVRLRVDYDEAALDYTFRQIEAERGQLVRRLVHRKGRPIGWYAYLPRRGGVSRVLHLGSPAAEADAVLGELLNHARAQGSAVVAGRSEPHLAPPLRRRFAILGFARKAVVHARDPQIDLALASSSSLLTQLDGEWYVN